MRLAVRSIRGSPNNPLTQSPVSFLFAHGGSRVDPKYMWWVTRFLFFLSFLLFSFFLAVRAPAGDAPRRALDPRVAKQ